MKKIKTIFYLLYIISYLNIYISSPGIVSREYFANTFKFKNEEDKLNYQISNICILLYLFLLE